MTRDDEQLDLGPLDPSRDAARWQRRIETIATEALRRRRRAHGLVQELLVWSRPALAVAAALAVLVWSQALSTERRATEQSASSERRARTGSLLEWAQKDQVPPPEIILWALEGSHASE
jgi:hypothetical protein